MSGISDLFGGTDDNDAQGYLQRALQQYQNLNVPTVDSEKVNNIPQETVQGSINPEQQQAVTQDDSALNGIHLDPNDKQSQQNALAGYQDIANRGGLDANAKLGIQQATNAANVQSQGAQGAIQQTAQAEGQGGGLNALVLRGQAAQNASNQAANAGLQEAAEAENNRQNALTQMASIGNASQNTDYNQAANTAASQNTINAANTNTKNAVNASNVGNNLAAQNTNLSTAQGVNAANTTAGQNQAYYNAQLPQQQFNDALQKASGAAGVNQNQASAAQTAQQNSANASGQLLKGGLTLAATAYGGPLAGAAAGSLLNSGAGFNGTNVGSAPGIGQISTPKNGAQYQPTGYADGGKVSDPQSVMADIIAHYSRGGSVVPGKAEVKGDSPANDKVPAMLSPGEIVIKRTKAANPEAAAKEAKKISMQSMTEGYKKPKAGK